MQEGTFPLTDVERAAYVAEYASRFTHPVAKAAVGRVRYREVYREARAQLVVLREAARRGRGEALRASLRAAQRLLAAWGVTGAVTFVLLPCDIPRTWPVGGERMAPAHINGGFTVRELAHANVGFTIYLFRREECAKVMLHEALHHTRAHVDVPAPVTAWLRAAFRIHPDTPLLVTEGIVEAAATVANAVEAAKAAGRPVAQYLAAERAHAFALARRLLAYQARFFPQWQEDTNAYAYIVVRALCFVHMQRFIELLARLKAGLAVSAAEWLAFFQDAWDAWGRGGTRASRGASLRLTRYGEYLRIR